MKITIEYDDGLPFAAHEIGTEDAAAWLALFGDTPAKSTEFAGTKADAGAREFAGALVNAARAAERNLEAGDPPPRAPGRDRGGAGVTVRPAGAPRPADPETPFPPESRPRHSVSRAGSPAGDHGLARTYWLFGAGVSAVVYMLAAMVLAAEATGLAGGWLVLHFLYSTLVWIGVWKAAARYAGPGTWRVLAKTTVVLIAAGALLLVATVLSSA